MLLFQSLEEPEQDEDEEEMFSWIERIIETSFKAMEGPSKSLYIILSKFGRRGENGSTCTSSAASTLTSVWTICP